MAGQVVPLAGLQRSVLGDARDGDRALQATWHLDEGYLVLSLWRADTCVASARLTPHQAAQLAQVINAGLAEVIANSETIAEHSALA